MDIQFLLYMDYKLKKDASCHLILAKASLFADQWTIHEYSDGVWTTRPASFHVKQSFTRVICVDDLRFIEPGQKTILVLNHEGGQLRQLQFVKRQHSHVYCIDGDRTRWVDTTREVYAIIDQSVQDWIVETKMRMAG